MLIALLPGDGIGPEVVTEAKRMLDALNIDGLTYEEAPVGGAAFKALGHPLPPSTLDVAKRADAILFGAVGDPSCDALERHLRPEQAILGALHLDRVEGIPFGQAVFAADHIVVRDGVAVDRHPFDIDARHLPLARGFVDVW